MNTERLQKTDLPPWLTRPQRETLRRLLRTYCTKGSLQCVTFETDGRPVVVVTTGRDRTPRAFAVERNGRRTDFFTRTASFYGHVAHFHSEVVFA